MKAACHLSCLKLVRVHTIDICFRSHLSLQFKGNVDKMIRPLKKLTSWHQCETKQICLSHDVGIGGSVFSFAQLIIFFSKESMTLLPRWCTILAELGIPLGNETKRKPKERKRVFNKMSKWLGGGIHKWEWDKHGTCCCEMCPCGLSINMETKILFFSLYSFWNCWNYMFVYVFSFDRTLVFETENWNKKKSEHVHSLPLQWCRNDMQCSDHLLSVMTAIHGLLCMVSLRHQQTDSWSSTQT